MKYATILLGLTIVLASVVAASAGDNAIFVCKPGLTEVFFHYADDNSKASYWINNKRISYPSPFFRFRYKNRYTGEGETLYHRGKKCIGSYDPGSFAGDNAIFVCKPGLIEVFFHYADDNSKASYWINNKRISYPSPLFRHRYKNRNMWEGKTLHSSEDETLYYRGQKCVGPYYDQNEGKAREIN